MLEHASVREVSVIGGPIRNGARSSSLMSSATPDRDTLNTLCLNGIADFKRPKDYVFVSALPKNNYGKILKTELRELDAKKMKS